MQSVDGNKFNFKNICNESAYRQQRKTTRSQDAGCSGTRDTFYHGYDRADGRGDKAAESGDGEFLNNSI